ncbi:OmpW family outer membrane protein [uncultured Acinetobacter sp.]|uniref:OmpW/AlkL family protein n=1 Tax=uncultured Acinetobacter sp. TaxID=165433 RepID=UPI00258CB7CD|nr:OmpW family outer membrane protein [uncultured Acinetobacter sp.]
MKKLTTALLPLALIVTSFGAHAATSDGKSYAVSAGWAHIMPQGTKQGVQSNSNLILIPSGFTSGAGFELDNADTAEFKLDYLVNDNVTVGLILGVPPKVDIQGKGKLLGDRLDLESFSKVGDVKVYSPVLTGKYTFGDINNKFRPYVGAGFMYASFRDFKLNPEVNTKIALLGGSIRSVDIDDTVAPVAFVGADYNITPNWFATASVSYVHLSTHANLDIVNNASNATLVQGSSKIEINPIVTYLGLGYRF